jgi:hypothetical protein
LILWIFGLGLLRLDFPGIIDPGIDPIDLPEYNLIFREVFVQIAEDGSKKPLFWQAEDNFLK